MLKNKGGFTLIELMVVVIIVGILASVAVPLYTGHVKKAMASEGAALLGSVKTAELIYFAEKKAYTTDKDVLGIDATNNKYFTDYTVECTDATLDFTATTTGTGDAANIVVSIDQAGNILWSKDGTTPTTPW